MAICPKVNLVLNINTPQYFENKRALKRPLEENFVTISSKRQKLSKPVGQAFRPSAKVGQAFRPSAKVGQAFRPSAKAHKLKINSFINSQKNKETDFGNGFNKVSTKSLNQNIGKNAERKAKVKFNSEVEVFPIKNSTEAMKSPPPSKLLKPDYIYNKSALESSKPQNKRNDKAPTSGKSVISSLFNKNPELPKMEKVNNNKGSSLKTFSTKTFKTLNISPKLISTVEKFGYTTMTLVQQLSIPVILDGNDALVKSQTGSGKTLSYALPIIHQLMTIEPQINRKQGLYALIVVPTRELAIQSYQWFEKLCKTCVWVVPGYLIGGEKKKAEKARIRKGMNVLVATPGRLTDHIDTTNSLELDKIRYLVLDEADRMLDMGYEQSIKTIIYALNKTENPESRQTIMLSATLTNAVEKLAGITLNSPKMIDVTSEGSSIDGPMNFSDDYLSTPENLTHHFMLVPPKVRLVSLAAFIIDKCKFTDERKMLVFMTTQDMVDYHTGLFAQVLSRIGKKKVDTLQRRALKVLSGESDDEDNEEVDFDEDLEDEIHFMKLHGSMTQPERTAVFKFFRQASSGVLLCTDVAARGLDLPSVNWIVQYNPASNPLDYVHRVGRTARADTKGSAVVFISPAESTYVSMLEKHGIEFNEIRMEDTLKILSKPLLYDKNSEKLPHCMEVAATRIQDKFENAVESDKDMHSMAIQGYTSFIRSYAAIPKSAREYFCFKLLHLGHYAKSFGLRDPPAVLGLRGVKNFRKSERAIERQNQKNTKGKGKVVQKERTLIPIRREISEFDSGLEPLVKNKKKKNLKRK